MTNTMLVKLPIHPYAGIGIRVPRSPVKAVAIVFIFGIFFLGAHFFVSNDEIKDYNIVDHMFFISLCSTPAVL